MNNIVISSNGYKIIEDKLELKFDEATNYFKASGKGTIRVIINDDIDNIIILKNNEELEFKDLLVSKVEFIRDTENCILARVKYCASMNS